MPVQIIELEETMMEVSDDALEAVVGLGGRFTGSYQYSSCVCN